MRFVVLIVLRLTIRRIYYFLDHLKQQKEERPNDVKNWSPEHVKQFLEEHMNDSGYDENDIKKIYDHNVDGYSFFTILTIEALTNKNGPFEIKFGPASHIMKLVREKREENTPAHVEVVTSSEFIKFREDTIAQIGQLKEKLVSIPSSNEFVNADTFKNSAKEQRPRLQN